MCGFSARAPASKKSALFAINACVLLWGFSFISIKIAVPVFPPMTLGALRFAIALVPLFTLRCLLPGKPEPLVLRDLPFLAGSALTGVTFYFFCENNGVALVTVSEASIITAAIPVLTMALESLAAVFFPAVSDAELKPLRAKQWFGAAVSAAGVALTAGVSFAISGSAAGYLYMGGAALCWVAYGFLTRPLFGRNRSQSYIIFWQNFFGFLGFLPFAAAEFSRWGRPSAAVWLHVLFLGLGCSALGYWLYARALRSLGISVSSVFINLIPVVTVVAGFFILGDRLSGLQWAGAALVLGGVYLTAAPR